MVNYIIIQGASAELNPNTVHPIPIPIYNIIVILTDIGLPVYYLCKYHLSTATGSSELCPVSSPRYLHHCATGWLLKTVGPLLQYIVLQQIKSNLTSIIQSLTPVRSQRRKVLKAPTANDSPTLIMINMLKSKKLTFIACQLPSGAQASEAIGES